MLWNSRYRSVHFLALVFSLCCQSHGSNLVNVALGKPTTQTDTYGNGDSSIAVDGDRHSTFGLGASCASTASATNTFWAVDLERKYPIERINITNRDTISYRLQDFYIYVSDVNPSSSGEELSPTGTFPGQLCLHYPGFLPSSGPYAFRCAESIMGRYVYLFKPGFNVLTICEFEVFVDEKALSSFGRGAYLIFPGTKYSVTPFHSYVVPLSEHYSSIECVRMCLAAQGGMATLVQMETAKRKCECIEELNWSGATVEDTGWRLLKSVEHLW